MKYLITLAAAVTVLSTGQLNAHGHSYDVLACKAAPERQNNSWKLKSVGVSTIKSVNCDYDSAEMSLTTEVLSSRPFKGSFAEWAFTAPTGTLITKFELTRMLKSEAGAGWQVYGRTGDVPVLRGETCNAVEEDECVLSGEVIVSNVLSKEVGYGFRCNASARCLNGGTYPTAEVHIYSARVTVTDPTPPTVGPVVGELTDVTAVHSGVETASFTATDVTGIREVRTYVDGQQIESAQFACDYTRAVPCSNPAEPIIRELDFERLQLTNPTIQFGVVDAAGNETLTSAYHLRAKFTAQSDPFKGSTLPDLSTQSAENPTAISLPAQSNNLGYGQRQRRSVGLRITRAVLRYRTRELVVRGRAPRTYHGPIRVTYSVRFKHKTVRATKTVRPHNGRWHLRLRVGRSLAMKNSVGRITVTAAHQRQVTSSIRAT